MREARTHKLADVDCRNAKGKAKLYKLGDGGVTGLVCDAGWGQSLLNGYGAGFAVVTIALRARFPGE